MGKGACKSKKLLVKARKTKQTRKCKTHVEGKAKQKPNQPGVQLQTIHRSCGIVGLEPQHFVVEIIPCYGSIHWLCKKNPRFSQVLRQARADHHTVSNAPPARAMYPRTEHCQNDFRNELSEQATVSSLHFPMAVDVVYSSLADARTVIFKDPEHRGEKQC